MEWTQQDIVLEWEITSPPEKESYTLEVQFGQSVKRDPFDDEYTVDKLQKTGAIDAVTADGSRRVLKIRKMENRSFFEVIPLGLLADHQSGEKVVFHITLNDENPEKSSEVKSQVVWERPKLTSAPPAPVLRYASDYLETTEPCIYVYDAGVFSFDSRLSRSTMYINGELQAQEGNLISSIAQDLGTERGLVGIDGKKVGRYVGVECDKSAGRNYTYEVFYENEIGKSASAKVSFRSVKPGKSQADVDAAIKSDLIGSCTGQLRITENSASSGDCGYMKIKVFQSDLDTGSCKFLGNWTDRNGTSRIGLFEYCSAFQAGSIKENYSYTLYVKVVGPTTYTTRLGTDRSVLEFSVLTDK